MPLRPVLVLADHPIYRKLVAPGNKGMAEGGRPLETFTADQAGSRCRQGQGQTAAIAGRGVARQVLPAAMAEPFFGIGRQTGDAQVRQQLVSLPERRRPDRFMPVAKTVNQIAKSG